MSHKLKISKITYSGASRNDHRSKTASPYLDAELLQIVNDTILDRLSEPMNVSMLSSVVGLSRSHFSRAFHKAVGEPPYAHVFRLRLERAMKLMHESGDTLTEIALATGFSDQAHFSNAFRRFVGTSPSQWRRSCSPIGAPLPGRPNQRGRKASAHG
jgi:transcriptional regulator GlxA family with amidase domain